ncbi:MAG: 50S ribosomal protein L11 methyltransferase [Anaerolineales bacterium]|nr:MAG: 50S ribosomal protein L11 methyltransferase [Anaerolineales bacterium]
MQFLPDIHPIFFKKSDSMAEKYWLEVSLTLNGELAEAVAEVLARYLPDGVVIESTAVRAGPADENGETVGPLRVCGYIPADESLEDTRQKIEQGLWYLGRISPIPEPEFKIIQEVNWMEAWKEHYHPIPIGNKLIIQPAWIPVQDNTRIPVRIDLGMAFGTGTHPTTQLCLALAEDYLASQAHPAHIRIIDIGCGSGILSIAGLLLGAEKALGVDIDAEAYRSSAENAALNEVSNRLELGVGSVNEVIAGKFGIHQAQLVFANILAPILIQLLDQGLGELVMDGGCIILSGILVEQGQEMQDALIQHGFPFIEQRQIGDWLAFSARR